MAYNNNPKDIWTMPFGSMANAYGQVNQGKGKEMGEFLKDFEQIKETAQKMVGEKEVEKKEDNIVCPYKQCPKCGEKVKKIEAGISSKNGKPYNAFWVCSAGKVKCGWTWNNDDEEQSKKTYAEDTLLQEKIQEDFIQRQKLNN